MSLETPEKETSTRKLIAFYPPVMAAWLKSGQRNLNYWVNRLLGEQLGVDPGLVEAYRRNVPDPEGSDEA